MTQTATIDRKLLELSLIIEAEAFWTAAIDLLSDIYPHTLAAVRWSHPLMVYSARTGFFLNAASDCQWALCGSYLAYLAGDGTGISRIDTETFGRDLFEATSPIERFACREATIIRLAQENVPHKLARTVSHGRTTRQTDADIILYHHEGQDPDRFRPALDAVLPDFRAIVLNFLRNGRLETLAGGVTRCLADVPIGLIVLDSNLDIQFVSREALRQAHFWRHAPSRRVQSDLRRDFRLPDDIYERLLDMWFLRFTTKAENQAEWVTHPEDPGLKALISRISDEEHPSFPSNYLVRFSFLKAGPADDAYEPSPAHLTVLAQLSQAERAVAMMVLQGLSNQEVAARLHRHPSTVKDHLTNIYAKLGIANRMQLSRLLTGG
jgi:DNA-binding CsgD family transcriptional regulator